MFNRKREEPSPALPVQVDPEKHVTDPSILAEGHGPVTENDERMRFREDVMGVLQNAFPGHEIIAKGVFDLVVQQGVRQFPVDLETPFHLLKQRPSEKPKILGGIINMVREQKSGAP